MNPIHSSTHPVTRRRLAAAVLCGLAWVCLGASGAGALPLISELLYDAVGSDDGLGFVELVGAPGFDLTGFELQGINGTGGSVTVTLALSGAVPADGVFVVADGRSDGTTSVAGADLVLDFDFQNGPDSVVLRDPGGVVVDALGYGVFDAGDVFAGEGQPAADPPAGSSLARTSAVDSDDNAVDFAVLSVPTPGTAPLSVPEPGLAGLVVGAGCAGVAAGSRRSRSRRG